MTTTNADLIARWTAEADHWGGTNLELFRLRKCIADLASLAAEPSEPASDVWIVHDGRRCLIERNDSGGWNIYACDSRRDLMLTSDGKWESYRGERKAWPTESAARAFLDSLAQPSPLPDLSEPCSRGN